MRCSMNKGERVVSKTYFWIEDRKDKSGYVFWQTLLTQLCPDMILESKKNCSELVKNVKSLEDTENSYIIVLDNSFDNLQVAMEQKMLRKYVSQKENIRVLDIVCFEYILLEFEELIEWIYAPDDEFLKNRKQEICARKELVNAIQNGNFRYKEIKEIISCCGNLEHYNVEQLSARLLFRLTRNTGFEVSKGKIGTCWVETCCEWNERGEDDICGLDQSRLSLTDKMKRIYMKTGLRQQFQNAGVEVQL